MIIVLVIILLKFLFLLWFRTTDIVKESKTLQTVSTIFYWAIILGFISTIAYYYL